MKKIIKFIIIILIVALLVVGGIKLIKKRKDSEDKAPMSKEYAVIVSIMQVNVSDAELTLPTIALAGSDSNMVVASKVAGRVLFSKKSGDIVKKGDILVKVEATSLRASIKSIDNSISSAKMALANAISTHKTTGKLLKIGGATKEQFDGEKVKIDSLKANIAALKSKKINILDNLSYAVVKAPSDGIVAKSMVSAGDLAMPGKPLIKLTSKAKSYLIVRLPKDAKALKFEGKEYPLSPLNTTFNGLNEYRADIDKFVPAGQRVDASIVLFKGKAIKLSHDTILNRDGKNYVLALNGKKVIPIEVNIVASAQEGVVVDTNLEGKSIVVAKPDILLRLIGGYPLIIKNAK